MGFGGVGGSGMGSYHGRDSFELFTHRRSIVKKYNWIDLPFRYQPYSWWKSALVRMFLK
jgi:aldehyde dehydrogenase (NAD+)